MQLNSVNGRKEGKVTCQVQIIAKENVISIKNMNSILKDSMVNLLSTLGIAFVSW